MSTDRIDTLPATWVDTRDVPFFRITAALFPPVTVGACLAGCTRVGERIPRRTGRAGWTMTVLDHG